VSLVGRWQSQTYLENNLIVDGAWCLFSSTCCCRELVHHGTSSSMFLTSLHRGKSHWSRYHNNDAMIFQKTILLNGRQRYHEIMGTPQWCMRTLVQIMFMAGPALIPTYTRCSMRRGNCHLTRQVQGNGWRVSHQYRPTRSAPC